MAVSITKYPGGLEQPTAWESSIQGLTPQGTYLVSFEEALNKFPGLQYSKEFQEAQKANTTYGASAPAPTTNETISNDRYARSAELAKKVDDLRAKYLAAPSGTPESRALYAELQAAVKEASDYSLGLLDSKTDSTVLKLEPELKSFPSQELQKEEPSSETEESPIEVEKSSVDIIEEFKDKLLDQAKGEAVDWSDSSSQEVAQAIPKGAVPLQGPATPVRYDEQMRQYVPVVPPDVMVPALLKTAQEPKDEQIAQALPTGPRGMDRPPGSYHPSNIMPLQTPGSNWRPGEGYMIQNPFERSPQTGPGLSQKKERAIEIASAASDLQKATQTYQSEFDPQKARAASSAAKEYRRVGQVEDPFRSGVFG